ncbi:uncharacterized protein Z519_02680 [Cladophialophora bantiana CBS 173.52]|uniref:Uncharacterized protein n=1 Tax=Cladophialophora bantiana (strain ATCC 10958 / CBS 173.52 / CDC B-1940 / NIH 8579) TaxID=1442370 RepID=A0A0D2HV91_CLAB1|nr:uncharacterized protein Z519_02680 [Cladophialophora bantiana CBS 173.52]KIW97288.1 hypothetical protein Z519_02680 [Cladophialophora bantiana CBS 173.52]
MPRMIQPLHVNEDDLERGPLNCIFLLQPFNLLPLATKAIISVLGGPTSRLWSDNAALQRWTEDYGRQLERRTLRRIKHANAIPQQRLLLKKPEPLVWNMSAYKSHCEAIVDDFSNTTLDVSCEM